MPAPMEQDRTHAAVRAATFAAAAIIAQQVGAKAARDALFLQNFDVDLLPRVLGAAALLAIPTVLVSSRLLGRFGPARLVPWAFAASAVLQCVLAALIPMRPGLAAVLFYFHVACFGAVLVSAFWSVVNERFDPRTARQHIGRIGTGATVGGVIGGVLATVFGRSLGSVALLLLLASLHTLAALAVRRSARGVHPEHPTVPGDAMEGLRVIAGQSYLRLLVALVVAVTAGAACLDFVFKEFAQARFGQVDAPVDLVTFFGVFHTGLSLLTFALQSAFARLLLDRAGLARTVATLPAGLGLGAVMVLLVPTWPLAVVARAVEAGLRSSLFRSAYELLYTPLPPRDKRAGKAIIDVGGERAGDAVGALLVQSVVLLLPAAALVSRSSVLLVAAVVLALLALVLTRELHHGYVRTLETSLRRRHVALHENDVQDQTTRTMIMRRREAADSDGELVGAAPPYATPTPDRRVRMPVEDPVLAAIAELRSGDPRRVMRTLATHAPLEPELIGHVVELLAWDTVAEEAIVALRHTGPRAVGTLIAAMLDRGEQFAIRRRAPRAIGGPPDALLVEGLLEGLRTDRFEIRFQCARTLARLVGDRSIPVDPARVVERILAEVSVAAGVWDSHRVLDTPRRDYLLDARTASGRAPVALHHVFTLLSLVLPAEPLQIALQGVLSRDAQMRGTALEYLESVLPATIRDRLWAHLERAPLERGTGTGDATRSEVLRTAMQTQLTLRAALDAALRRDSGPSS